MIIHIDNPKDESPDNYTDWEKPVPKGEILFGWI